MERERRKTSVEWPVFVDERLRLLVVLVEQAAQVQATSASELLAALVCDQPIDGDRLADTVIRYRNASPIEVATTTRNHRSRTRTPRRGRPRRRRP